MRPKVEDMVRMVQEYCAANNLDPMSTSVTFNAAYEITGHVFAPSPGFPLREDCCCGVEDCDGGLTERLEAWGVVPDQVTVTYDTIPLGEK